MVSPASTLHMSVSVSPSYLAKKYKERDDDLMKAVECPSCEQVALPPIVNCSTGHIICSVCRPKVMRCKVCSSHFTSVQNVAAEDLVALLDIKCQYPGCGESFKGDQIKEHTLECSYRPVRCNETQLYECKGKRIEFQSYIQHLHVIHGCAGIFSTDLRSFKLPTKNFFHSTDRTWPLVPLIHDGKNFVISRMMKASIFYCYVSYVGPDAEAAKFNACITIDSGRRETTPRVDFTHPVHTFRARFDSLEKCGHIAAVFSSTLTAISKKRQWTMNETTDANEYAWQITVALEKS